MDAAEGVSGRIKDADAVGVGRRKDDKMPTQSVLAGTKTTRPSPAVAAPTNLKYSVSLDEMSTQTKRSDFGSKMPTQPPVYGAKTTRPSLAVVAPRNLKSPAKLPWSLAGQNGN